MTVFGKLKRRFFQSEVVAVGVVAHISHWIRHIGATLVELGGDLEAVEQEASALGVDALVDDCVEDLGESDLQSASVFQRRQLDAVPDILRTGGAPEVDMVVAKGGLAEGWGFALVSAGHDVATLVVHSLSYSPILCKEVIYFLLVTEGL